MATRIYPLVGALGLLLAAGSIAAGALRTHRHEELRRTHGSWRSHEGVILVWAVKPKDLISCRSAGYSLRRVQRAHSDLPMVVASVDADTAWVASMLRSERLDATIRRISDREYRSFFGDVATPLIFVLENGRVVSSHQLDARNVHERDALEQTLRTLNVPTS